MQLAHFIIHGSFCGIDPTLLAQSSVQRIGSRKKMNIESGEFHSNELRIVDCFPNQFFNFYMNLYESNSNHFN